MVQQKIKKILLAISICVSLFVVICLCIPFLRHRVLRVPIKTEEIFPMPDRITCFYDGQSYTFTQAQAEILYELLTHSEHYFVRPVHSHDEISAPKTDITWQFDYYDRYQYTKRINGQVSDDVKGTPFRKLLLKIDPESLRVIMPSYHRSKAALTFDTAHLTHLIEFINMTERFALACIIDTPVWLAENTTPAATDTFPAKPDEIYVYYYGESRTLKAEECDALYLEMMSTLRRYTSGGTFGRCGDSLAYTEAADICIELRYRQRQLYTPNDTEADGFATLYNQKDYDALLFAINFGKSGIDNPNGISTAYVGVFSTSLVISYNMAREPSYIQNSFLQSLVELF